MSELRRERNAVLVIPTKVDGFKVTKIKAEAFTEDDELEFVCIQADLIEIEQNAFAFCENLKTINLPPSVRILGDAVFEFCLNLRQVVFKGNALARIDKRRIFLSAVGKFFLSNSVTRTGKEILLRCRKLKKVWL